jgi:biopolymer transport protein ExbD
MAIRFKKRIRVSEEIPQASMSDVAFLLLIFFIVSTSFPEKVIPLILPSLQSDVTEISRKNVMQLIVARDGLVYVDFAETPTPVPRIEDLVRQRLSENPEKLVISIESHEQARYGTMIDVLDEVKQAGARKISLKMLK